MNQALLYLWVVSLKRGMLKFVSRLRRPSSAIGFVAILFCFGLLFHYRHETFFRQALRREILIGGALIMVGGAVFKGFMQRGLVFELPDVEFLFAAPFTRRQVIQYSLLSSYLYSLAQGAVVGVLFAANARQFLVVTVCFALFQAACFHASAGAAIFAGTLRQTAFDRLRWMMLIFYGAVTALYLRFAWDFKLRVPSGLRTLAELLFYPSVDLSEIGMASGLRAWTARLANLQGLGRHQLWLDLLYVIGCAVAAAATLRLAFGVKGDLFEPSLSATTRVAERAFERGENTSGRIVKRTIGLPSYAWFGGVRAIVWKNLVGALRSRRELFLAAAFTTIYTGFLVALSLVFQRYSSLGGSLPANQRGDFENAILGMVAALAFLLQRSFPFDFRRDGAHLIHYRTLPVSAMGIALAELAVPLILCLTFQLAAVAFLSAVGTFRWSAVLFVMLAFPAVALGLNGIWNAHYLIAARKRAGRKAESSSPVTLLMVVSLSFLIFYPAGWLSLKVGRSLFVPHSELIALGVWLIAQYTVDFALVMLLATLFRRFEVPAEGR